MHVLLIAAAWSLQSLQPLVDARTGRTFSEEVMVQAGRFPEAERSVPSQQTLGAGDILALKSLLSNDPMRAIQALPGVTTGDDFRSEFAVRGSGFDRLRFTFEGVPTTLLLHTVQQVRDGGSIAMINSDVVAGVALLYGAYPQRYGNRLGAELDFRMRDGARDRVRARVSVSGTDEGHFGFSFADAQARVAYDLSPRHRIDLSVVAGGSRLDQSGRSTGRNFLNEGRNTAQLVTAGWRFAPGAIVVQQRVAVAANQFRNRNPSGLDLGRGAGLDLTWRADALFGARGLQFETGAQLQRQSRDVLELRYVTALRANTLEAFDDRALWSSAYAQARWSRGRASLTGGGRVDRQSPSFEHVVGLNTAGAAGDERAYYADIGLEQTLGASTRSQITFYNREDRDLLRRRSGERMLTATGATAVVTAPWQNALDGGARGAELLLQRRSSQGLSGWLSYSLARSRYRDRERGEAFDGDFDQRHTLNAYLNYRVSARTGVAARFRTGSNVPAPGYFEERDGAHYVSADRNRVRVPKYARLDLRGSRAFPMGARRLTLFAEVINALDGENARFVTPDFPSTGVFNLFASMLPRLPSAGILFEF